MAAFGMPTLNQVSARATKNVILGTAEAKLWEIAGSNTGRWGIYKAGYDDITGSFADNVGKVVSSTKIGPTTLGALLGQSEQTEEALQVDSVVTVQNRRETTVSAYRIENGMLQAYNKVRNAEIISVQVSKHGNQLVRKAVIDWLDKAVDSTTLYNVVTPEKVFKNMTLESYEEDRDAKSGGASTLFVDCMFREVMSTNAPKTAKTQNAISSNDVIGGALKKASTMATSAYQSVKSYLKTATNAAGKLYDKAASVVSGVLK